jgi:hypothetical protein
MIVGTHFGLFMPALRPDWEMRLANGEAELQVRSRRSVDLANLREFMQRFDLTLQETIQLKNTDYQFRAYCTRDAWAQALAEIGVEIDYTKFKDTPAKKHGDHRLTVAYGAIWTATLRSFPTGSVYTSRSRGGRRIQASLFDEPASRNVETVYRTENREWRMKGASPADMAALMREIDAATEGVTLPTDAELNEIAADGMEVTESDREYWASERLNDHSKCTHGKSKSARQRCCWKRLEGR